MCNRREQNKKKTKIQLCIDSDFFRLAVILYFNHLS